MNPGTSSQPTTPSAPSSEVVPPVGPVVPPAEVVPPKVDEPVVPPKEDPTELDYEIEVDDNSPLSDEELGAIAKYAEEHKLSKEAAQQLVSQQEAFYNKGKSSAEQAYSQKLQEQYKALNEHPEFSGANKEQSWAAVKKALEVFGDADVLASLGKPEFGYDVKLALMLKNIGKALMPETVLPGGGNPTGGNNIAKSEEDARLQRLYPAMFGDKK